MLDVKKKSIDLSELKAYVAKMHGETIPDAQWERRVRVIGRKRTTYYIQYYVAIGLIGADTMVLGLGVDKRVKALWIKAVDGLYQFNESDKWLHNLSMEMLENRTMIQFDPTNIKRADEIGEFC